MDREDQVDSQNDSGNDSESSFWVSGASSKSFYTLHTTIGAGHQNCNATLWPIMLGTNTQIFMFNKKSLLFLIQCQDSNDDRFLTRHNGLSGTAFVISKTMSKSFIHTDFHFFFLIFSDILLLYPSCLASSLRQFSTKFLYTHICK